MVKIDSLKKAYLIAKLALDKEAEDLKILDLRKVSNFCDFFVVVRATSGRRALTIADNIKDGLQKENIPVRAREQDESLQWVLLDAYDVVAHIFTGEARRFYNLEKLWQDAKRITFPKPKNVRKQIRKPLKRKLKKSPR